MDDIDKIRGVIQQCGIYNLAKHDGCLCGGFELRGISIDVSCPKGDGCMHDPQGYVVRVYASHNGEYIIDDFCNTGYTEEDRRRDFKRLADEVIVNLYLHHDSVRFWPIHVIFDKYKQNQHTDVLVAALRSEEDAHG